MFAPGPTPLGGSVLAPPQAEVAAFTGPGTLALRGLPGTGKTTALQACLAERLAAGQRPDRILVMVPQRAHVLRYEEALRQALVARGAAVCGGVDLATFYGFCQRQVALFWPLIAAEAGFAQPDREPVFLTIETTQYYMWRVVAPLIARHGYFSELAVRRGRLLSQLIDNLNKSALVGFDHREIAARLSASWTGSSERLASFQQAQDCATRFRTYCLEHGLLDFSLVCDLLTRHLLRYEAFATYFGRYECLVVDNLEENVPAAHDLIRWAAARCPATLLAVDEAGGTVSSSAPTTTAPWSWRLSASAPSPSTSGPSRAAPHRWPLPRACVRRSACRSAGPPMPTWPRAPWWTRAVGSYGSA